MSELKIKEVGLSPDNLPEGALLEVRLSTGAILADCSIFGKTKVLGEECIVFTNKGAKKGTNYYVVNAKHIVMVSWNQ